MEPKVYLTPMDVQQLLNIGRSLAYQMFGDVTFPTIALGRKLLVRRDELDRWLHEQGSQALGDANSVRRA